jgi:aspartate/methionine/tyrosine aminotransferase
MYTAMTKEQLQNEKSVLQKIHSELCQKNIKLDMSRGKPADNQMDLVADMLDASLLKNPISSSGVDYRNYGIPDGIMEAKKLFSEMLGVSTSEIIVGGNSSLQLMYDAVTKAMLLGVLGGDKPWVKYDKVKFLCPAPGYDRHFGICEALGIEMITVEYRSDGPDMDTIEKLVAEDETIKGVWCVPMYSNPEGITYSDDVVRRFANLSPKAKDFRIFWDHAYCVHHLTDTPDTLLNILDECKKTGKEDMVYIFASTSKISIPGAGVAVMAGSEANMNFIKKQMFYQTIGYDKLNQLRHARYFKNLDGVLAKMEEYKSIIAPKFKVVLDMLDEEIAPKNIARWNRPRGGYFVSFHGMPGTAKRIVELCQQAGVVLTGAGATYPYGKDPYDANIRIAPTYPTLEELKQAMEIFCVSVKLASVEKLLQA